MIPLDSAMKLSEIFSNYYATRKELVELTSRLTEDQLQWKPAHHPSSIQSLLIHITISESWWIEGVTVNNFNYTDYERFKKVVHKETIFENLEYTFKKFSSFLDAHTIEEWDKVFYNHSSEEKVSMRWLVWHVVEHQLRHRGQILMLMSTQGIKFKDV